MAIHKDQRYRRHQDWKAKQKAERILKLWGHEEIDSRLVGIEAGVHCKRCSCYMCGNPRRWFGELTVQERMYGATQDT